MPVTVTETAARRIDQIIAEHGFDPATMKLRVGVKGGGCSGFNYTLDLTEVQKESDEAWTFTYSRTPRVSAAALGESSGDAGGTTTAATTATATTTDETFSVTIVCDPKSYLYLNGTSIDYKDEIMGSGFVFNNPNSTSTCGCGSSFSA
jgi:iron-sulfur cluster assembly protein